MNIQELNEYCQKVSKKSLEKSGWMDKGFYFVKILLPNGLQVEVSEKVDFSKPKGFYTKSTTQLAVNKAMEVLGIASLSNPLEKKIPSQFNFPDTKKGRAAFRKAMATAVFEKIFTLEEANNSLHTPFTGVKEAENLANQLRFDEKMTIEDIELLGKSQTNKFGQMLQNAGWTENNGTLASKKLD